MTSTADTMLRMSRAELDELFSRHGAGPIPTGEARGTAIIFAGSFAARVIAPIVRFLAWQGKVFDPDGGRLRNKILPFGIKAIVAKVYRGDSWLDGKECVVIDYSKTSLVAGWVRDEIRLVAPGVYLGKVYGGKRRLIDFVLET